MDYLALKKARRKLTIGQETLNQVEHIFNAGAKLIMGGVLVQGTVITDDPSSAPVLIGIGKVLRIQVAADTYLAFYPDDSAVTVDSTTSPALKLPAGYHLVVATDYFLAMSAAPARLEVITDGSDATGDLDNNHG
jgi:hypothetical protein